MARWKQMSPEQRKQHLGKDQPAQKGV